MKFTYITLIAALAAGHANSAELLLPDATKQNETFTADKASLPQSPKALKDAPGPSKLSQLPPPPLTVTPAAPQSVSAINLSNPANPVEPGLATLREVQVMFQSWQVAAVLDTTAVLRAPLNAVGMRSLTVKSGEALAFLDDIQLTAVVDASTVQLTANLGKLSRIVFIGQMPNNLQSTESTNQLTSQVIQK
jgi:hypothetical protein